MTPDFRALCAELVDIITAHANPDDYAVGYVAEMLTRARAALADEPAAPEGGESGAADLETEFRFWWKETYGSPYFGAVPLVAVLAWTEYALAYWGNPAPAPPADGELAEVAAELRNFVAAYKCCHNHDHIWGLSGHDINVRLTVTLITRAAELLQRQALVPVSVSERLPGPGDCLPWPGEPNAGHWCWAFIKGPLDDDSWERRPVTCLTTYKPMHSHWLPANALPLPEVGE